MVHPTYFVYTLDAHEIVRVIEATVSIISSNSKEVQVLNRLFIPLMLAFALLVPVVDAAAQAKVQITLPEVPYQKSINTNVWLTSGQNSSVSFSGINWQIPVNKVLVIEHVSARVRVNPEEKVNVSITCQGQDLGLSEHQLTMTFQGQFDGFDRLAGSSPLRCYTRGTPAGLVVGFLRNSTSAINLDVSAEVSVTGYLADPPK